MKWQRGTAYCRTPGAVTGVSGRCLFEVRAQLASAVGRVAQFAQDFRFDLANPLARDAKFFADFLQRAIFAVAKAVASGGMK